MKKLCTFPGCSAVVEHPGDNSSPRCAKHPATASAPRKRYNHHYDDNGRNLYKSARWKRLRKAKLLYDPYCEHCLRNDRTVPGEVVDHIKEVEDGGEFFDLKNLQTLCHNHHNTKTGFEKRKRGKKTEYKSISDF